MVIDNDRFTVKRSSSNESNFIKCNEMIKEAKDERDSHFYHMHTITQQTKDKSHLTRSKTNHQ